MERLKLIECPRDAMQGLHDFIPTDTKVGYINELLKVGFDTIDFGSFVSPKAIPQMRDTADVLKQLDLSSASNLLAIVANPRGAEDACSFDEIRYLGYPFSVSEQFQQRNTNASIEESLQRVEEMQRICSKNKKELVVYLSMGFGNPYGEEWNAEIVLKWCERLYRSLDVKIQALSDTIGCAKTEDVRYLFQTLTQQLEEVEFGAHLHARREDAQGLVQAAYASGCRRFDGAIRGFGGCPMAKDDLTGNMPTEEMLAYFSQNNIETGLDVVAFQNAMESALSVFPN